MALGYVDIQLPDPVLKRQTIAGIGDEPELSIDERQRIQEINMPSSVLSQSDADLLKKQSSAGIGDEPELSIDERQRIQEINSRQH